jgi:catechol 2,3-dioxygenase
MSSVLGKDGVPLVQLIAKPADQPDNQVSAGLYHTAFLMPSRKELGRWLIMAVKNGVPFTGFADHFVSEALYLNDPEGNGVEVYADRPPSAWKWNGNQVVMGAEDLKVDDLVKGLPMDGSFPYTAPAGFRIGHVHLRVGDLGKAQDFYIKAAGLDLTDLPPNLGAAFFSNGRYHHHIGSNVWQSAGAGQRPGSMSGLDYVALSVQPHLMEGLSQRLKSHGSEFQETANGSEALDPWGTKVRFISA